MSVEAKHERGILAFILKYTIDETFVEELFVLLSRCQARKRHQGTLKHIFDKAFV